MRRVVIDAGDPDARAIAAAVEILHGGGVVAFPTDTLYGLAVDPRRRDAVERLFALKGREATAAVPLVASSLEQAVLAADFTEAEWRAAATFWPGPLSIVAAANASLAREALGGQTTVAIRVPAHEIARALARAFGFPITATSANRSGQPPADSAEAVAIGLGGVDALVDGGRAPGGAPSTIIAFDGTRPRLVREGAVPWDRVIKSLR
ncbi:MAG: L-threonylcarbamoyladenylate synthase [Vicinamibacterales bacterium]